MVDSAMASGRYRLWKQGLYWLLLLGPLFFLSYGQVNHFTATRADVGSLVFRWEHAIPFIPWTIVPYWSIDLLYGLSLFICTSQRELTRHAWRLLAASLVACVGFLLFPLRFTFSRPESPGIFGWLFHQLEQFDLPYNQAPSLHIILAWLLWPYLVGARLSKRWFSRTLPVTTAISGGVSLGGFPDKTSRHVAVLDLTAEFHHPSEPGTIWYSCPMMDLLVPEITVLQRAVEKLTLLRQSQETVLVCCALGLSRSATVVAAWLLTERHADSVAEAVEIIRSQRPQVVLTQDHLRLLEQVKEAQCPTSV